MGERVFPCSVCYEFGCDCAEWAAYWDSLTPQERDEEFLAMCQYGEETRYDGPLR